jgi:hypothetical protein
MGPIMYSRNPIIIALCLLACTSYGQNRIWSSPTYGKVDPREWMPENLHGNCIANLCCNHNPSQFSPWSIPDGSKNNKNGSQTNANLTPVFLSGYTNGNGCLSFDSVDDVVDLGVWDSTGSLGSNFTAMVWIKHSKNITNGVVFAQYNFASAHRRWQMWFGAAGLFSVILTSDGAATLQKNYTSVALSNNAWNHIGITWGYGVLTMFLNGVPLAPTKVTDNAFSSITDAQANVTLRSAAGGASVNLDSPMLFNVPLSTNNYYSIYAVQKAVHP